ncbi:MAG: HK97 family phage prohead protease [Firmicutes bacterium]|nr:HK97 family phage prohead protease [Bacillota bacterium]
MSKTNNIRGQPLERRAMTLKELRVSEAEGKDTHIEGYASVFDSWSETLGGDILPFREKVIKGAFSESIANDDIRALYNHDPNYVLGRNKAGTLELTEDDKGLYVKIKPPKAQWAKDLMCSIKRGDVDSMSFGFAVILDKWYTGSDGGDVRELIKVKLYDVSPVTFPAYPATECDVRSVYDSRKKEIDLASAAKAESEAKKQQKIDALKKAIMED